MRADRLMHIMMLLQNGGKMTTKELAAELEVSERTIMRDMEALAIAGNPIVSERGKDGGWRLLDNFRSKLSGMKIDDIKSLLISASSELLDELGINSETAHTREKLIASLPEGFRAEARSIAEKVYIDPYTWRQTREKADAFIIVQEAVWLNKKLDISYENGSGEISDRIIEPLGLIAKGNKWYLAALRNGEMRTYRISRITTARVLDEHFIRPAAFKLADYWNQSKEDFVSKLPAYEVTVELDPAIIKRISFSGKFVRIIQTQPSETNENWVSAALVFHSEQEAIEYILGFGDKMKVLKPAQLTEKIVSSAQSVINFYKK